MIKRLLEQKKGVFIGRNGSIEMNAILTNTMNPDVMERHTGVWPASTLQEWRLAYLAANRDCDVIAAGWYANLCLRKT
jgi:hypothetical protein